jgi:hypothetical protein
MIRPIIVRFLYLNHRGEMRSRRVEVASWEYGTHPPYHPEPCLLLKGICLDSNEPRAFAIASIYSDILVEVPQ